MAESKSPQTLKRQPTVEDYQAVIIKQDQALINLRAYIAMTLKANGGKVQVPKDVWMSLDEHFEIMVSRDDDKVTFSLLEGKEAINAAMGRTPGGIVVPT